MATYVETFANVCVFTIADSQFQAQIHFQTYHKAHFRAQIQLEATLL